MLVSQHRLEGVLSNWVMNKFLSLGGLCEFATKVRELKSRRGVEHLQAQEMAKDVTKCNLNILAPCQ